MCIKIAYLISPKLYCAAGALAKFSILTNILRSQYHYLEAFVRYLYDQGKISVKLTKKNIILRRIFVSTHELKHLSIIIWNLHHYCVGYQLVETAKNSHCCHIVDNYFNHHCGRKFEHCFCINFYLAIQEITTAYACFCYCWLNIIKVVTRTVLVSLRYFFKYATSLDSDK